MVRQSSFIRSNGQRTKYPKTFLETSFIKSNHSHSHRMAFYLSVLKKFVLEGSWSLENNM